MVTRKIWLILVEFWSSRQHFWFQVPFIQKDNSLLLLLVWLKKGDLLWCSSIISSHLNTWWIHRENSVCYKILEMALGPTLLPWQQNLLCDNLCFLRNFPFTKFCSIITINERVIADFISCILVWKPGNIAILAAFAKVSPKFRW